jgi:hypothetical protein
MKCSQYDHLVDTCSVAIWRSCITLEVTGFLNFVHRPVFWRTRRFGKWIYIRPQLKMWDIPTLLSPLERAGPVIKVSSFSRTQQSRCLPHPHLKTEADPVSETLCSLENWTVRKAPKLSNPESDRNIAWPICRLLLFIVISGVGLSP